MAGSLGVANNNESLFGFPIRKYTLSLTSDASGNVSGNNTSRLSGTIVRVTFDPDGTDVPTSNYDLVLNDENGVDVLAGQGANLSDTTSTSVIPGIPFKDGTTTSVGPMVIDGELTPVASNMGNAKKTKIILYLR